MRWKKFVHPLFGANAYVIYDETKCIVVDPNDVASKHIESFILERKLEPVCIVNTHGHWDHISGNGYISKRFNIPIVIHEKDAPFLKDPSLNLSTFLGEPSVSPPADDFLGDSIFGLKVIHTPGHTPGSVCLMHESFMITGDTLFKDSIGRTDLPMSNDEDMLSSLKKLVNLLDNSGNLTILPGHGEVATWREVREGNEILWSYINSWKSS